MKRRVDPDAAAFFSRLSTPPTAARSALYNTLITSLKTASIWDKLDVLYILAAADSQAAGLNLKGTSYTLSPVNSPVFVADQGYTGDTLTNYLDTGLNPSTSGGTFMRDNKHLAVWTRTGAATANTVELGNTDNNIACRQSGDVIAVRSSSTTPNTGTVVIAAGTGFTLSNRVSSTTNSTYKNGAVVEMDMPRVSSAPASANIWICGRNNAGSLVNASSRQISVVSIGGGLTGPQIAAFYAALNTYLVGVGAV